MGYDLVKKLRLNGAFGYTVDFQEKGKVQTNQPFISTSLQLGPFMKHLDVTPYYFTQEVDGINNRTSVGMESRWGHPRWTFFNLVDYELEYGEINIIMLNALYRMTDKTNVNLNFDDRKSPILQTRNALNDVTNLATSCGNSGAIYETIEDALVDCSEEQLRDFALLKTGTSRFVTMSVNHTLSRRTQLNFDVSQIITTLSNLVPKVDNPIDFDEVIEDSDQISGAIRLVVSQLFQQRDTNIFGFRMTQDQAYNSMAVDISNRLNFGRSIRFSTRLTADLRNNSAFRTTGTNQLRIRPSIKLDYRWKRSFEIQAELTYDTTTNGGTLENEGLQIPGELPGVVVPADARVDSDNYLFTIGFRQDF